MSMSKFVSEIGASLVATCILSALLGGGSVSTLGDGGTGGTGTSTTTSAPQPTPDGNPWHG